ncbi:MAG: CHASE3 domain-containing protein [Verrucomicrobiota bacterium]|jgi:PAS domain S-box-containing protein
MKENIEKRVVGLFILMLLIIAGVAWEANENIKASINKTAWVNQTHQVILDANDIAALLHKGDASMSAYLLTGDKRDQANYRSSYSEMVNKLVVALRESSQEAYHKDFTTLTNLIGQHINFTRTLVQARESGGADAARQLAQSHPDGESTTEIDRQVRQINDNQESLLRQRDQEAVIQATNTKHIVFTGVAVNFVLLIFCSALIRDDLKSRRVAATALEEANAQLEAKVQERTAELVKSNQLLKKENLERRWSYQALDHQFRYNQLIVNSISELVFVVSKALNISRVNPAVAQITQWQAEDLVTQPLERVLQVPQEGATSPMIAALNDGRELQERPAVVTLKNGTTIPVRFNLVPLRDDNKVVGGVVTVRPWHGEPPKPA